MSDKTTERLQQEADTTNAILDLLSGIDDLPAKVAAGAALKVSILIASEVFGENAEDETQRAISRIFDERKQMKHAIN